MPFTPIARFHHLTTSHVNSIVVLLASLTLSLGCQRTPPSPSMAGAGSAAEPPLVDVAPAVGQRLINYREFTGRTTAVDAVDIRARVSGYLVDAPANGTTESMPAQDANAVDNSTSDGAVPTNQASAAVAARQGQLVEKGALLFRIDPQPYQLALAQAEGSLRSSEAQLQQSERELERQQELVDRNAVSRSEFEQAALAVSDLRGQIESLRAVAARNRLDLEFTEVRAPITGLLGQALVTPGNLVVADTTLLCTVVAQDPIFVEFDVDEASLLDYRRRILQGEVRSARDNRISIRVGLTNEEGFPHEGFVDFVSNQTNANTGNTRIRGTLSNESRVLSPGLFAKVQIPFTAEYDAILIPSAAIAMDQQGRYAMVVDSENQVQRRSITIGSIQADTTEVREGIQVGERVVVSGLQRIRPGMKVRITESNSPPTTQTSDSQAESSEGVQP